MTDRKTKIMFDEVLKKIDMLERMQARLEIEKKLYAATSNNSGINITNQRLEEVEIMLSTLKGIEADIRKELK